LQAVAYDLGMVSPRFDHFFPDRPVDASHPDLLLDFNRCILCELCVRASAEVDQKNVFALSGRGITKHLIVNAESGRLTDTDIARCYDVMAELRPHIPREGFAQRIRRQMTPEGGNYRLAFAEDPKGEVVCVAGYRYAENLVYGRNMYVDDLVSSSRARSAGFGGAMLAWLEAQARANGCIHLHLDSGVTRHAAHRFYLRDRYDITGPHVAKKL
jgi:GNAT superfamily N-acetyltransferase